MRLIATRALALSAGLLLAGLGACGSSNGARCPDPKAVEPCPVCPAPPKAGPTPLAIPADTLRQDRERRITLVAFSEDGARALLRVEDDMVGDYYQTVLLSEAPVPKIDKTWMFQQLTEPAVKKQALRAIKPHDPGPPSQENAAGVTLVAADDGDRILVLALHGERAVPIATLPRLVDADKRASDVSIVKLAWDPTGTRAVVIHGQALAADQGFESQWIHVVPVDPKTLPF